MTASYAFCTVLFRVVIRDFVSPEFIPLERKSQVTGKKRWGMSHESCKKPLVTPSTAIGPLGDVSAPTRFLASVGFAG
jgi:hypothetical protein